MLKFLQHRIADKRILRLIKKWLKAGVIEDGKRIASERGTPQGAVISPLLANIYLHYVFDTWAHHWREHTANGDVIMVRYADDIPRAGTNGGLAKAVKRKPPRVVQPKYSFGGTLYAALPPYVLGK